MRELMAATVGGGYQAVSLCSPPGTVRQALVHRLVAAAFIGESPGMVVMHLNHDIKDNRSSNLRYGTHKENTQHSVVDGRIRGRRKFDHDKIRNEPGLLRDVAKKFGCTAALVSKIRRSF